MSGGVKPEVSALGISLSCTINEKRALVVQTHLSQDTGQSELNGLLERMCKAADRLDTRYRLSDMKLILQKQIEELPLHEQDLVSFEEEAIRKHNVSGRRGDFQWKGQDDTNRKQKAQNVAVLRRRIEDTKKAIAEAEAVLAE